MRASRALVYLTAASLPAYLLRFHVGPLPTTVLEVLILATVAVFAVESYVTGFRPRWPGAFTGPMLLLAAAIPIEVWASADHREALGLARAYFIEPALYFAVACSVLRDARDVGRLCRALFVSGALISVPNLVVFGQALAQHRPDLLADPPVAWYTSPNDTGLFLGPLVGLAGAVVIFASRPEQRADRLGAAAFLVLALPACLLSLSRGAWLALVVAAVFLAAVHPRRRLLLAGVALLAAAALLASPVRSRISHELNASDPANSLVTRGQIYRQTYHLLRDRPLLGAGIAGYPALVAQYRQPADDPQRHLYPHNIALDFWVELGIVGLAGLAWFGVRALRWVRETLRVAGWATRPLVIGSATGLVIVLVHGLIDNPFFKNDLAVMTLGLCAVLAAGARIEGVRLRSLIRIPGTLPDIEPAELPMPADIPRRTGRASPPAPDGALSASDAGGVSAALRGTAGRAAPAPGEPAEPALREGAETAAPTRR